MKFTYNVTVECGSRFLADRVLSERLGHDEDYGFDYTVDWSFRYHTGPDAECPSCGDIYNVNDVGAACASCGGRGIIEYTETYRQRHIETCDDEDCRVNDDHGFAL